MSVKLFCGFDFSGATSGLASTGSGDIADTGISAATGWASYRKPLYLFHNRGIPTLDQTLAPPNGAGSSGGTGSCFGGVPWGGCEYGQAPSFSSTTGVYTGASSVTRATFATAQGFQLGIVRSLVKPALSADEYWFYFKLHNIRMQTTLSSSFMPSASWGSVFKWGDVEIKCKEAAITAGSGTGSVFDVVFSIRNNGSEIATVTVPYVISGNNSSSNNTPMHCFIHVKLHATQGVIDVRINGLNQSVAYVNENTVQTTSEASATEFYIGPPIFDDGTTAYAGTLDDILIDDAEWPIGIPRILNWFPTSDVTLTNAVAAGTSPTTVVDAITSRTDAKALRFTANTGKALLGNPSPSLTSYHSDILAIAGMCSRFANRNILDSSKLEVAISLSAVESADEYIKGQPYPFSVQITPPETVNFTSSQWEIFEKPSGGGKYQTSEVPSLRTALNTFV